MGIRIVIAGAGGFGRGVYSWLSSSPKHLAEHEISEIVYIDDASPEAEPGAPVVSSIGDYIPGAHDRVLCAVGDPKTRESIVLRLADRGARFHTLVDDRVVLANGVTVGEGSVLCPGVVVSADVSIGRHVHVNFNCSIGHDTVLGDFTTLSPAVNIMGEVQVGSGGFFGGSSTVLPRLTIGSHTVIGAGAVVVSNLPASVKVKGVPARW